MINLLPPIEKQKFLEEKTIKGIVILSIVISAALCVLASFLLLIEINLEDKLIFQRIILEDRQKQSEFLEMKKLEGEVTDFNQTVNRVEGFYKEKLYVSDIVEKVGTIIPGGVSINNFSFERQNRQIFISGIASTREALLILKGLLEKDGGFAQVYFPASNWTSPKDINFSITLKIR